MRKELRERREKTWELLVVKGLDYGKVVTRLAEQYDVSENAIEQDISRMDSWLPELNEVSDQSGVSRLRELRENRQRLQQMAIQARKNEGDDGPDLQTELKIRRQIDKAIEMDVDLSQSLGLTEQTPEEYAHEHSGAVDHDHDHEHSLDDDDREMALEAIRSLQEQEAED